jgi:DNA-binding CsgD family transcriptional regulator
MELAERDEHLTCKRRMSIDCAVATGRVALVAGPVGSGKTRLPRTLAARTVELDAILPPGVLTQLLHNAEIPAPLRNVALPELASARPVIVSVGDLQHADAPSLRFVLYLIRRPRAAHMMAFLTEAELRQLPCGHHLWTPLLSEAAVTRVISEAYRETAPGDGDGIAALTRAERRVAVLAVVGHTNREIADKLFVTESTVEQHLTRVYRKLDIRCRSELPGVLHPTSRQRREASPYPPPDSLTRRGADSDGTACTWPTSPRTTGNGGDVAA